MSAKLLGPALLITGSLALLIGVPLLFAGGDVDPPTACAGAGQPSVDVDVIAETIRQRESGNDYRARADGSTASGAYQFTDGTWANYHDYPHAWLAPPSVQDAKATEHIDSILSTNDGDIGAVPVVWYIGYLPSPDDPAWDTVPSPGAGNHLTPRQYQDAWLTTYASLTSTGPAAQEPLPSDSIGCVTTADKFHLNLSASGRRTTVEGITVDDQIAPQVQQLVQDARRSGYHLTGTGYRSHQQQIALRRAHCGPSDYAVYEMPAGECSPPTARPGTSLHEQGLAIDFSCDGVLIEDRQSACFTWMATNAPRLGLHNLPSEPWHWSTTGSWVVANLTRLRGQWLSRWGCAGGQVGGTERDRVVGSCGRVGGRWERAVSPHGGVHERRWRQWQAFADHFEISALPADPMHVAAFVVARFRAGVIGDYASHSPRAGFVSDALDSGATREQVQRHGRWTDITSIDPYYRKTQTWGRNNPSQHLANRSPTD